MQATEIKKLQQQADKAYCQYKKWFKKVNRAPVDAYGGAKNQEKVDEYMRKAVEAEALYDSLQAKIRTLKVQ